ncbi:lipocalin [Terasakiispira papahanaumokuakeensis]|uniref:Outer membrane lipoprotein Blc n=2 Tax=Terasakiispira papahanaumokuakeensis TaxID=197479 RepID=A0A1E2VDZ6_9GAMM|nr:lipocalin family protein [Terasakiispira papahanaumokuakeensis]ODC05228.1 lipocalin [Terasakiispira papahanaumokuakeensis]
MLVLLVVGSGLTGCVQKPENVEPVQSFDVERYLGQWYEIARLDHSFERGLSHVTATYSWRDDGGVKVINRGYDAEEGAWQEAEGKAYFVEDPEQGYLKVSFFGPFYGGYIVFKLDDDYQYAYVSGPDTDYLWLLARTPQVSDARIEDFKQRAEALGFDLKDLIMVDQSDPRP